MCNKTEEANAETEAENRRIFRLEMESGIGHSEFLDGVFEILILVVGDREEPSIDEW